MKKKKKKKKKEEEEEEEEEDISIPTAPKFLVRSFLNRNLRNSSGRPSHTLNLVKIGQMVYPRRRHEVRHLFASTVFFCFTWSISLSISLEPKASWSTHII